MQIQQHLQQQQIIEPNQNQDSFELTLKLVKANSIISSFSIVLDILLWYLILSLNNEIIIITLIFQIIHLILLLVIYFSLKSRSLTYSKIKILCSFYLFLSILSLLLAVVEIFFFYKGINSEKRKIMNITIIVIYALLHLVSLSLFFIENNQLDKIINHLSQEEMNRELIRRERITNIEQNETAASNNAENNLDDPNFIKEKTVIIVYPLKEKSPKENKAKESTSINKNEKIINKINENIIIISQNKTTDNSKEDEKSDSESKGKKEKSKEQFIAHKVYQNQTKAIIYKHKIKILNCSQEIIESLNRNYIKSTVDTMRCNEN